MGIELYIILIFNFYSFEEEDGKEEKIYIYHAWNHRMTSKYERTRDTLQLTAKTMTTTGAAAVEAKASVLIWEGCRG